MRYQSLLTQNEHLRELGSQAMHALHALARAANGTSTSLMPAPTCYELLGSIKVGLWRLGEVVEFMPTGLRQTLDVSGIVVTDSDFASGEARDPHESVTLATEALEMALRDLRSVVNHIERAQSTISCQGYEEAS